MAKVLLVDDDLTMVQMVAELLRQEGHEVFPFTNGPSALAALAEHSPELVITDLYFDKTRAHGLEILERARELNPPAVVIVITGYGTIETAVDAMRKGAFDYLEKPFKVDALKLCIQRALSYTAALTETTYLRKQLRKTYQFGQIIGGSEKMRDVFHMVERVADTESTILILGESGTGKELVARALHFNSRRHLAPFVPINCSALPENLLESELFGHRRGSFTGAINDKKGLFQEADGGTIFLDEIGTMPATLQSRLLRVLQEREIRRVGDNAPVYVDVRVVAATNEPLEKRVKEGAFREDLYYRLNVIAIQLPSLRERPDDIPLLVSHFLKGKLSRRANQPFQITRQAMDILCNYGWPGNVRELENAIERAAALCEGETIVARDLPPNVLATAKNTADLDGAERADLPGVPENALYPLQGGASGRQAGQAEPAEEIPLAKMESLKNYLRDQEQAYMSRVLDQCQGDKEKAALVLGVSLATLYRKLSGEEKE
ncbi:MAG TPA: sigma-54 dependent transcriptional regulator [Verrucomicrobiae bacterium]|nr:sigma-54 dependent transcriptional regulator [Verrucomicrobiae bacterium]